MLAGGGVTGIAWLLGFVDGLRQSGVDVSTADTLVGTSAGACVAAQLATGKLDEAISLQRQFETSEIEVEFDGAAYVAAMEQAAKDAPTEVEAVRRIANFSSFVRDPPSPEQRRAVVAARLPSHEWPEQDLVITAVDRQSGELVEFRAASGVPLVDAVAASCAVPGVWPATEIGGRAYVDGGVRSNTNADLGRGHDTVFVLVPVPVTDAARARLQAEIESIQPAHVHVVQADAESLAAIGPNPLSAARRAAVLDGGYRQASTEASVLAQFWH